MGNNNRRRNRGKKRFDDSYVPPFSAEQLAKPISELKVQPRTAELLGGAGFVTLLDIVKREEKDLYKIKTFNKKNLFDVVNALKSQNGMYLKPTPKPEETAESGASVPSEGGQKPQQNRDGNRRDDRRDGQRPQQNRDSNRRDDRRDGQRHQRDDRRRDDSRRDNRDRAGIGSNENGERFVNVTERSSKLEREKQRPQKTKVEYVSDSYVKMNKNGKWGFMNREGREVVDAKFDDVSSYKEDLCAVEIDEKMGYIDREGNFVIEPQYDLAMSFSEGYANVYRGEKCGYIDKENNVVVEFIYDAGTSFVDGNCRVKKDGRWGELFFIDTEEGQRKIEVRWII